MPESDNILVFDSVTTQIDPWYDRHIENFSLLLRAGDLGLIRFDRHSPRGPIPDAAMGLTELANGEISFLNQPWSSLKTGAAARQRGLIGRLFGEHGWVHHLDVDENITLGQRHHTHRRLSDIETEAEQLAHALGLTAGLPRERPNLVDPRDLQRAACVRMLLGSPPLIVVDEPPSGLYSDVLEALREQIGEARARGAAALWLSADPTVGTDESIKPTWRIDMTETKSAPVSVAADRKSP